MAADVVVVVAAMDGDATEVVDGFVVEVVVVGWRRRQPQPIMQLTVVPGSESYLMMMLLILMVMMYCLCHLSEWFAAKWTWRLQLQPTVPG